MTNPTYHEKIKFIKDDVRKIYDKLTRELANNAKRDLTIQTRNILTHYYDSYTPAFYNRTNNLYNMIMKIPLYRIDNGLCASIAVTYLNMDDNYNIGKNVIFDQVWENGHRGLPFQDLMPRWYPRFELENHLFASQSPHLLLKQFINKWYKIGTKQLNDLDKKYKSRKTIKL